jgi:hypothetical protein
MDKENVVYIDDGILFIHKEQNQAICKIVDGTGNHQLKKKHSERQISCLSLMKKDMKV